MAPTTAQRPARHAFSKAVRGVIDQSGSGDTAMKEVGPVRASRITARKKHATKDKDKDAMQVERAAKVSKLASRIGPSRLSIGTRIGATKATSRLPAHEMWREFVKARYNAEAQFLDLSAMAGDPVLKKYNLLPPGVPGKTNKAGSVIFKLAATLKPQPITISLARNGLTSTADFATLSHYLPNTRNLSLEGNQLSQMQDLEPFAGRRNRLTNLRELILAGNPLRETEFAAGRGNKFHNEIARRFPSLEILDGQTFSRPAAPAVDTSTSATGLAASIPVATEFSVPMKGGAIQPDVQGIVSQFCTLFFDRFDNNRADLAAVYSSNSVLSFSVNASIPPRAKIEGWHTHPSMPHQRKLEWSKWFDAGSRNLQRFKTEDPAKFLATGIEQIGHALGRIPGTKHNLTVSGNFVVDARTVDSTLLMVAVHGQFTEAETQGIRSFDRTFLLAPASPDSAAQVNGWPVQIVNDMFVIRAYSSPDAWTPGSKIIVQDEAARTATFGGQAGAGFTQLVQQPQISSQPATVEPPPEVAVIAALPPDDQAVVATLPEAQRIPLLTFCARTGLRVMTAGQCLESNAWDLEKAWANFETVRLHLPADSFFAR